MQFSGQDHESVQDETIESQGESAHEDHVLNPAHNMSFQKCVTYKKVCIFKILEC